MISSNKVFIETPLTILLLGNGGREHAIAWKLLQSRRVERLFIAPGNGGTANLDPRAQNVALSLSEHACIIQFSKDHKVDLVVVGPEQPLVDGIADLCKKHGISCFGPSQSAARIEGSKAFAKSFMKKYGILTAPFQTFTSYEKARAYVYSNSHRIVIKASGLAAGKGVFLPTTTQEAEDILQRLFIERTLGNSAQEVVIEDYLDGEEVSVLAFTDGYTVLPMPVAQDHKRLKDGDKGPNTGGMGAYAPVSMVNDHLLDKILNHIFLPTLKGLRAEGCPFVGVLYAGLMIDTKEHIPYVLEFNCRFGDPEAQVILPILDCDLAQVMLSCTEGCLDAMQLRTIPDQVAATIVLVAKGYPGNYVHGIPVYIDSNLSTTENTSISTFCTNQPLIFHGGTRINSENQLLSNGGRVLAVSVVSSSFKKALEVAYSTIQGGHVRFDEMQFRKDIGHSTLKRELTSHESSRVTYADAGVHMDRGDAFVERIKPLAQATRRIGADTHLGGFAGLFDLRPLNYRDPILAACTDGVGTKLRVAQQVGQHQSVGMDLVAMCVNDLIVQGAEPLFFLDYIAAGKLQLDTLSEILKGVSQGCIDGQCALIGGETAEMPGMYPEGEYDLAGFAVGILEREDLLPRLHDICTGDVVMGISSSGIHSNGFSLVRYIIEKQQLEYTTPCPFSFYSYHRNTFAQTLGEAILEPTRIYVRSLLPLVRRGLIKAMAHITGGGLPENLPRVIPTDRVRVHIQGDSWPVPEIFHWLKNTGPVSIEEMARTFNCGIGMVLIVDHAHVDEVLHSLRKEANESVYCIGVIESRKEFPDDDPSVFVAKRGSFWACDPCIA